MNDSEEPQAAYPPMPKPDDYYPDEPTGKDRVHFLLDAGEPLALDEFGLYDYLDPYVRAKRMPLTDREILGNY